LTDDELDKLEKYLDTVSIDVPFNYDCHELIAEVRKLKSANAKLLEAIMIFATNKKTEKPD